MKRLIPIIALVLIFGCKTTTVPAQASPLFFGRSKSNVTSVDTFLKVKRAFYLPTATSLTLNGGLDSIGAFLLVTSSADSGINYRTDSSGVLVWRHLMKANDTAGFKFWNLSGSNLQPISNTYNVGIGGTPAHKFDVFDGNERFYTNGKGIEFYDAIGTKNTLVGVLAGTQLSSGDIQNIAIGSEALRMATGDNSVAIGKGAGFDIQVGNNVAVGANAGRHSQYGNDVAIGSAANINSFGGGNIAVGSSANTAKLSASGTLNNSDIVTTTNNIVGSDVATFITATGLSVGDTATFEVIFLSGVPAPFVDANNSWNGKVTASNTIQFQNIAVFTSQGSGTFNINSFNRQFNSIAICDTCVTDSSNQIRLGNNDNTVLKLGNGNMTFDLTSTPHEGWALVNHSGVIVYDTISGGGGGSLAFISPLHSLGGNVTIDISAADNSTVGVATYSSNDFNNTGPLISIDWTNTQKATISQPGALAAADFASFAAKQPAITGALTPYISANGTASRVVVMDGSGKLTTSGVTTTTLNFLDVTSSAQTQLNGKLGTAATSGQFPVANGGGTLTPVAMSGDATLSPAGVLTLDSIISPGTCSACNITWNAKGQPVAYTNGVTDSTGGTITNVLVNFPLQTDANLVTPTLSVANAVADNTNRGVATFATNDFNSLAGAISIDWLNTQKANAAQSGALLNTDWVLFNGKVSPATTVSAGSGLTGGGALSSNVTISMPNTGVSAGTYTAPSAVTVDAQGRILSISAGTPSTVSSVFGRTGDVVATSADYTTTLIPEGTNLYYTNARADARIAAQAGVANGLAQLDGTGKVPAAQLPAGSQVYKGTWDVSTNTPTLSDGVGTAGWTYRVTVGGTRNLGSGNITWSVGDDAIYNGTIWQRNPSAANVTSVNGLTGTVVLTTDNITQGSTNLYFSGKTTTNLPEGSNLYYTDARARAAMSAGTGLTLSSGTFSITNTSVTSGTYSYPTLTVNAQGQISTISTNTPVTTFAGRSGAVVPILGDYTTSIVAEGTNLYWTNARGDARIAAQRGVANGIASLDGSGKVPVAQLPAGAQVYKGTWNAATNTPTLADGTGSAGDTYRVTVAGTQNLGSGPIAFSVGDDVIYNGTIWQRNPSAVSVTSVNGLAGTVVLTTDNIAQGSTNLYFSGKTTTNLPEGSNLYFTNARARTALSAGTGIGFNTGTGVISLANTTVVAGSYTNPSVTVNAQGQITVISNGSGGGGGVASVGLAAPAGFTVSGSPVTGTGTLTFTTALNGILRGTGANAIATTTITAPLVFSGGALSIPASTDAVAGYLTAVDHAAFNAKAPVATGAITTVYSANLTSSTAVVANAAGKLASSVTTLAELATLSGIPTGTPLVTQLAAKEPAVDYTTQVLTDGATITWNVNSALRPSATVTLGGNRVLAITNPAVNRWCYLTIIQDATGSRTLTLPVNSKCASGTGTGTAINLSSFPGSVDRIAFFYDGTNFNWVSTLDYN